MRVRDTGGSVLPAGAVAPGGSGSADRATGAAPAARATYSSVAGGQRPMDVATIMGIPEAELTPKVRAAIDRLMAEVQNLREGTVRSRRRIEFLEHLADQDPLAPVLNRRAFVRELARTIAFAERYSAPGSVIYFDIDGMKQINDRWGHSAGDSVLKYVGEMLVEHVRASDIVGRLGGDEFGVILAQADGDVATTKATALVKAVESRPAIWRGSPLQIGLSYGIHTFTGGEAVEEAIHAADAAMYARKRA